MSRILPWVAVLTLAAPAGLAASAGTAHEGMSLQDVSQTQSVLDVRISPDASQVAFLRSRPRAPGKDDDGASWTELYLWERATGKIRPYITGEVSVRAIEFTPDGEGISFLDKRGTDKHPCLYVIPTHGGEARRALGGATGILSYSWNHDGTRVAYIAEEEESKETTSRQEKGFRARLYEEDLRARRVWIGSPFEEATEPRLLDLEGSAWSVAFSPMDDRAVVAVSPTARVDDQYMRQSVLVVDTVSGEVRTRLGHEGKLGEIRWSPDGQRVAAICAVDLHDPHPGRLMVCAAEGGVFEDIHPGLEGDVDQFAWQSPEALLSVESTGVFTAFRKRSLADGAPKDLMEVGGPALTAFSLSRDGQHGAFVGHTPTHPGELFVMSHGDSAPTRITHSNAWLEERRLAPQEVVTYRARDGLELQGLLLRPLDAEAGRRYPLILVVHGGPESHYDHGWLNRYSTPAQVAAARGFAVFFPNYRGSTGRGVEFSKLSQGDPAGKEFDDLVDGVDHLIATGLVDRDRVGVTGGSYGGYATGWCATRYSDRFAAGVMFVGISNKISKVGTTDIPDEEFLVHARKRPWDDWQFFLERSPIYHAENCKTPLLILHGEEDPRVNVGQSRELYRHIKLRGAAPVRLVLYPGEGHGNRKAAAQYDYSQRLLRWMEHYLMGPGGSPPDADLDDVPAAKEAAEPTS